MRILIVGDSEQQLIMEAKFGEGYDYDLVDQVEDEGDCSGYDIIIDFFIQEYPEHYEIYRNLKKPIILLNSVLISLAELQYTFGHGASQIFGFNGMWGFIENDLMEISALAGKYEKIDSLNIDYVPVDDRVGMVTPRVVCMIINEAYYTVQEGTATKEDIDKGMKLGTNYPYGPFEWAEKIGISNVYELLESLYVDTKEGRYKIAPLLKNEYLLEL